MNQASSSSEENHNDYNNHSNDSSLNEKAMEVLYELDQMMNVLKELDMKNRISNNNNSRVRMLHYTTIPLTLQQCNDLLYSGCTIIHSTSTKFTLLKSSWEQQVNIMTGDFIQGCQCIMTSCVSIPNDTIGCCRSYRKYYIRSIQSIISSVIQLIQLFIMTHTQNIDINTLDPNIGASQTGTIWERCDYIINKRIPITNNRTAIRHEILNYIKECHETIQEFDEMIHSNDDEDLQEQDEQEENDYSIKEIPIAKACIGLLKCSKNSLNIIMLVCDTIGNKIIEKDATALNNNNKNKDKKIKNQNNINQEEQEKRNQQYYESIAILVDVANMIGLGVTDLGSCLYPPFLDTITTTTNGNDDNNNSIIIINSELEKQIYQQIHYLEQAVNIILLSSSQQHPSSSSTSDIVVDDVTNDLNNISIVTNEQETINVPQTLADVDVVVVDNTLLVSASNQEVVTASSESNNNSCNINTTTTLLVPPRQPSSSLVIIDLLPFEVHSQVQKLQQAILKRKENVINSIHNYHYEQKE